MSTYKARIITVVCVLAIGLVIPIKTTVVPAASVRIVDQMGNSMPHVYVKQEWHDATVENQAHNEIIKTDESGVASFPTRYVRSFLLKRIINVIWRIATQEVHASIGSEGSITAYANGDPHVWGWVGYNRNGGSWPKEIQLKRWEAPAYH